MQEVYEFLKKCGTYYLATMDGDQPRVRPFGTVDIFEGKMYIQTGRIKPVSHQIEANPKIEICALDSGKWIRISATAVEDTRYEPQKHLLDAYPSLQSRYQPDDGNNQVFWLKDATAVISSFTSQPKIIEFGRE